MAEPLAHPSHSDAGLTRARHLRLFLRRNSFAGVAHFDSQLIAGSCDTDSGGAASGMRCTLVRHSCTIRKMAVSISAGKRRRSEGISRLTWILLRSAKPSTYHFNADVSPTSSSSGGCSKWEIVRIWRESSCVRSNFQQRLQRLPD